MSAMLRQSVSGGRCRYTGMTVAVLDGSFTIVRCTGRVAMFGFLMGLVLGAIGGAAYGSRYFRDSDLQTQFNDTQDRLTNLMTEVRSVLDETRGELRQAWERTREIAVEKAERIQTAAGDAGSTGAAGGGGGTGSSTGSGSAAGSSGSGGASKTASKTTGSSA